MTILIIQLLAIVFAVACAYHDAPAVSNFERNGVTGVDLARFHHNNALLKTIFCVAVALSQYPNVQLEAFSGGLAALWIWVIFDPVLNLKRHPSRPWDYLGLNDWDGQFWNGVFGQNSGKWKAAILFTLITTLNILFYAG